MKRITRRQLLGSALVGVAGLMGWYAYDHRFEDLVVSILRSRLSFLNLDDADLGAFAADFTTHEGSYGAKGKALALTRPVLGRAHFLNVIENEIDEFEYKVVSQFLLSSDFFWNGADEIEPVRYLGYNDYRRSGCANPFARFD